MFSLPHFRLQPVLPLLFSLFVQFRLRGRFPRAAFGGASSCLRAFLMKSVNQGIGGQRDSDLMGVGVFNPIPCNVTAQALREKIFFTMS